MGDIYSFIHKSTSYQCFCMTDQACPTLYFVAQYVGARTILKLSIHSIHSLTWSLLYRETYDLGWYLSRLCIILSASLSTLFLLFSCLSASWTLVNLPAALPISMTWSPSSCCHSCLWSFWNDDETAADDSLWRVWVELLRQTQINPGEVWGSINCPWELHLTCPRNLWHPGDIHCMRENNSKQFKW